MQTQPFAPRSGTSSRLVYGLLALFALPFIGGGLLALVQGLRHFGTGTDAIILIVVGAVFIAAGVLLAGGVWYGAWASAKDQALQAQYPGKPWMWRKEWANRVIKDSNKGLAIGMWIFAFFWNSIAFPIAIIAVPKELAKGNHAVLFALLFPLVGIGVLIAAIYLTLRSIRFGTSLCHIENVPIVPGRRFRGDVALGFDGAPEGGYRFRISSIHSVTTRMGKSSTTTEHVLWDAEVVVDAAAAMRSPQGTRVPFELATPPDSHTTDESDSNSRFFWRLSASAQFPGVDYGAQFRLPVFQTGEAVDGSEFAAFQQKHRAEDARHQLPVASGVRVTPRAGGGEEFRIEAKKTIGGALASLLFLAAWNVSIVALFRFGAPVGIPVVFILIDLLIIYGTADYFFGKTTITADPTGVSVRKDLLGTTKVSSYDAASIASIDGTTTGASFSITLKLNNGSTQVVGGNLSDRESADIVAAKMMADLRRA